MKQCTKCKKFKDYTEFYPRKSSGGYRSHCKTCEKDTVSTTYASDTKYREASAKNAKAWRECNPERFKVTRRNNRLIKLYNSTPEEYEYLYQIQSGKCAVCKNVFASSKDTHIDHDHVTGKVRGILCSSCNTALGLFKDDTTVLEQAIAYLQRGVNNG